MAKKSSTQTVTVSGPNAGWGNQVLGILFTIFILAIVFGVLLIASTTTGTTINQIQRQQASYSTVTTNSVAANTYNGLAADGNVLLSWSGATNISSTYPVSVTIFGNIVTTAATNGIGAGAPAASNAMSSHTGSITFTSTSTAGNQVVTTSGMFYNISKITVSGLTAGDSGAVATVEEVYYPFSSNTALNVPATGNTITATGATTVSGVTVGTSSATAVSVFGNIISYLVTLSNFAGIIILLAIIVVVVGVLYYFFGNRSQGVLGSSSAGGV